MVPFRLFRTSCTAPVCCSCRLAHDVVKRATTLAFLHGLLDFVTDIALMHSHVVEQNTLKAAMRTVQTVVTAHQGGPAPWPPSLPPASRLWLARWHPLPPQLPPASRLWLPRWHQFEAALPVHAAHATGIVDRQ